MAQLNFTGTSGNDTLDASGEAATDSAVMQGLAGNDCLIGGAGDDRLFGDAGSDTMLGGAGNDLFFLSPGGPSATFADSIDGGSGYDTLVIYAQSTDFTLTPNSDGSWTATGAYGTAQLTNIESIKFNDTTTTLVPVTRDFNGDYKSDILFDTHTLAAPDGLLAQWHMNGATYLSGDSFGLHDASYSVAATGDFNGDGKADILWHAADGTVSIWLMNGTTVTDGAAIYTPVSGQVQSIAGVGDFNGDGKSDILFTQGVTDTSTGKLYNDVSLWEMNGVSSIGGGDIGVIDAAWSVIGTGDFNGDGKSDILFANADGRLSIWEMNGTTYLGGGTIGTVTSDWTVAGVGDFNGDGRADILFHNTDGSVAVWEMNGTAVIGGGTIYNPGTDWQIAGIGDYNGDGKSDILWRHVAVAGSNYTEMKIWTMNGTTVTQDQSVSQVLNDWQVV